MINKIIRKVTENQFLVTSIAFQILLLTTFISRVAFLVILFILVSIILLFKYNNFFSSVSKKEYFFSFLFLTLIYFTTSFKFFGQNVILFHFLVSVISIFSAFIFTRDFNLYYLASKYTLILFQVFILGFVLLEGFDNYPIVVPLENLVKDSSANGITSYSILLQVNFSLISFIYKRKFTFITTFLTLIIALVSYGRGSILSASLILLTNFIVYIFSKSSLKIALLIVSSILIVFIVQYLYSEQIKLFLEANTKLSAGLVDDSRSRIISDYIGRINFKSFFLGAEYGNSIIETEFNGNPHNSYIRAHHIFGLSYLLLIIFVPFIFIFRFNRSLNEIFFSLLLLLILIFRSFSEPIIAPTLLDFYFFAIFFILARNNHNNNIVIRNYE